MPHLQPELHDALVELLTPHVVTQDDRMGLLSGPRTREALEKRVILSGTAEAFASAVVVQLTGIELVAVLDQLKGTVGHEQQSKIDSFCAQIQQSTGGSATLSQLIDRWAVEIGPVPPPILRLLLPSGIRSSAPTVAGLLREVGSRELPDETPRFLILSVLNRLEHYFRVIRGDPAKADTLRLATNEAGKVLDSRFGIPKQEYFNIAAVRRQVT